MEALAEPILERDKERGGEIVVTMPTTSDAVAVQNRPAPSGKPHFWPSAALLLLDIVTTMSRRRALHPAQTWGFQRAHNLVKARCNSKQQIFIRGLLLWQS